MSHFFSFIISLSLLSVSATSRELKAGKVMPPETRTTRDTLKWEKLVFDDEKIFTAAQVDFLDSLIDGHKRKASNEIMIVSLAADQTDYIITQAQFDEYANVMFTTLDVGSRYNNRGIGLFFSAKLGKIRIEVSSSLSKKLTDNDTKKIIDELILPSFKRSAYFTGITNGLRALVKLLE